MEGRHLIVEANCVNGCRFYGADVPEVVAAISKFQARSWGASPGWHLEAAQQGKIQVAGRARVRPALHCNTANKAEGKRELLQHRFELSRRAKELNHAGAS